MYVIACFAVTVCTMLVHVSIVSWPGLWSRQGVDLMIRSRQGLKQSLPCRCHASCMLRQGATALHTAVDLKFQSMIKILVDAGADLQAQNPKVDKATIRDIAGRC